MVRGARIQRHPDSPVYIQHVPPVHAYLRLIRLVSVHSAVYRLCLHPTVSVSFEPLLIMNLVTIVIGQIPLLCKIVDSYATSR
jgi:hypothetical protein